MNRRNLLMGLLAGAAIAPGLAKAIAPKPAVGSLFVGADYAVSGSEDMCWTVVGSGEADGASYVDVKFFGRASPTFAEWIKAQPRVTQDVARRLLDDHPEDRPITIGFSPARTYEEGDEVRMAT